MIPSRDRRTFDEFVVGSADRLAYTAYLLCGDRGHAEDLVQTALLRTARRWRSARRQPEAY
ncbi:sigma factor, partial [Nocardioides hankookensis]